MKHKKGIGLALSLLLGAQALTAMPVLNASAATLLSAEFETTDDSFQARGTAAVGWTSDEHYTDNCSLFVHDRGAAWAGAARTADSFMKAGQTYSMSAAVYQTSGAPVEMKFSLQYTGSSGTEYDKIALETVPDGEWTLLSNPAYTVPAGATGLTIYVETTEAEGSAYIDFYLDSVKVTGKPAAIKAGDANGDLKVNIADAVALVKFLTAQTAEIDEGGDYNGDGKINAVDLSLLKNALLFPKTTPITVNGDWDNYQEDADARTLQVWKDGVARVGNTQRIREKIAKAQSGETVSVGYLGGSITEGGSSTSHDLAYSSLSFDYFNETFAGGTAKYVNAGMSGTSSVVGNVRVHNDIFAKNCDIIFIEFAVNDQGGERFQKSYESLVKTCLEQENAPAVILITLCQKSGSSNQDWMEKVAQHYDLPLISGKNAVMNGIQAGTLDWDRDYGSNDTIHPGNGGHRIIANLINYYYRQALKSENTSDEYEIPSTAIFGTELVNAKPVKINPTSLGSWRAGTSNRSFPDGFTYTQQGRDPLTFTVTGKSIVLLFKSNSGQMGTVDVNVNGKSTKVTGDLQWTWGGPDGDIAYIGNETTELQVSISSTDGKPFEILAIGVVQ